MNVMITSIGQRGYLVDHFRDAMKPGDQIFGCDATEYAPALQVCDRAFKVPRADNPQYSEKLLSLCLENQVDGLISINDLELPHLAAVREDFRAQGVVPVISSPQVVEICFDKYQTYQFCRANGIGAPITFLHNEKEQMLEALASGEMFYPVIAKPRRGSRSQGIRVFHNEEDLLTDVALTAASPIDETKKVMYQQYVDSEQYSFHAFNDWEGRPVIVIGMVNLVAHMTGETYHIRSLKDEKLIAMGKKLAESLKHVGPLCADVHKLGDEFVLLELNPRIGGCYSLSHYSGADFPGKIMRLIAGEPFPEGPVDDFEDGVVMLKQYTVLKTSLDTIKSRVRHYE